MLDASQLLRLAEQLAESPARGAPPKAKLRRAISTAYYALFHRLVAGATDLLAGGPARGTRRYMIVYRSFEHKRMAEVCRQIANGTIRTEVGGNFDVSLQECATAFIELQQIRHEADYDPFASIALSDAKTAVVRATTAIQRLNDSPEADRLLFRTLLHFKPRS